METRTTFMTKEQIESNKCSKIMRKQQNKRKINVNNFLWNELRKWRLPLAFGICGGKFLYILWTPFLLEHDFSLALLLSKRKNQKNKNYSRYCHK